MWGAGKNKTQTGCSFSHSNPYKHFSRLIPQPPIPSLWASSYSHSRFPGTRGFLFLKRNGLRHMNIFQDFPAPREVGDQNQGFPILRDFQQKWTIGRYHWLYSHVHSRKANSRKIKVPTDLSLSPYQGIPRRLYGLWEQYIPGRFPLYYEITCTFMACAFT